MKAPIGAKQHRLANRISLPEAPCKTPCDTKERGHMVLSSGSGTKDVVFPRFSHDGGNVVSTSDDGARVATKEKEGVLAQRRPLQSPY